MVTANTSFAQDLKQELDVLRQRVDALEKYLDELEPSLNQFTENLQFSLEDYTDGLQKDLAGFSLREFFLDIEVSQRIADQRV